MHVDLVKLRALRSGVSWSDTTAKEWDRMLGECFDELEALRAEVERLKAQVSAFRSYTRADVDREIHSSYQVGAKDERAAIVAWLRGGTHGYLNTMDITSRIERGGHHESADK